MTTEFEAEMASWASKFNTPGLAVELLTQGKRHSAYLGLLKAGGDLRVTKDTRFGTICMIKVLIAIQILMMAEKGEIDLDAAIAEYLPELANGPKAKGKFLKVRHLLSHTGGFRSFVTPFLLPKAHESWENCVTLLHDTDQLFEPGTVFDDEHLGHIILGQMLQRLKSRMFLNVIRDEVLAPLGIRAGSRTDDALRPTIYASRHEWSQTDKRWEPEDDVYGEPDPAFGAISNISMTSADMLHLGEALLDSRSQPKQPGISPWVKDKLFSQVVPVHRAISPLRVTRWHVGGFGLGMAIFQGGHRGYMTTGRGQNSCIVFDNDRQSVLALAMNAQNVFEREELLNTAFSKFAGDSSIVPEPRMPDIGFDEFIHPFTPRDIAGAYVGFRPEPVEIFATPNSFSLRINKEHQYEFQASPEGRLVMRARMPVSVGLFQDPVSGQPTLMMGMNAFKKVN